EERPRADGSLSGYDYFLVDIDPSIGGGVPSGRDPKPPAETQETAGHSASLHQGTPVPPPRDPRTHQENTPNIDSLNTENSSLVPTVADQPEPVDKTEEEFPKELKSFVASLDYHSQIPSRAEFVRIAKAAKRLHAVVNPHDLKTRISENMRGV